MTEETQLRSIKPFKVDTALAITTGRVLTNVQIFVEALSWITGESLSPYALGRARVFATPILLEAFPVLMEANEAILDEELKGIFSENERKAVVLAWLGAFIRINEAPIYLNFPCHSDSWLVLPDPYLQSQEIKLNQLGAKIAFP